MSSNRKGKRKHSDDESSDEEASEPPSSDEDEQEEKKHTKKKIKFDGKKNGQDKGKTNGKKGKDKAKSKKRKKDDTDSSDDEEKEKRKRPRKDSFVDDDKVKTTVTKPDKKDAKTTSDKKDVKTTSTAASKSPTPAKSPDPETIHMDDEEDDDSDDDAKEQKQLDEVLAASQLQHAKECVYKAVCTLVHGSEDDDNEEVKQILFHGKSFRLSISKQQGKLQLSTGSTSHAKYQQNGTEWKCSECVDGARQFTPTIGKSSFLQLIRSIRRNESDGMAKAGLSSIESNGRLWLMLFHALVDKLVPIFDAHKPSNGNALILV